MCRWFSRKSSSTKVKSSQPEVLLGKGVLKICSKFTVEHPCQSVISIKLHQSVISIKLHCIFIEITLWHGCSPVNLLHIFRTPFPRNTFGWLLLIFTFPLTFPNEWCSCAASYKKVERQICTRSC